MYYCWMIICTDSSVTKVLRRQTNVPVLIRLYIHFIHKTKANSAGPGQTLQNNLFHKYFTNGFWNFIFERSILICSVWSEQSSLSLPDRIFIRGRRHCTSIIGLLKLLYMYRTLTRATGLKQNFCLFFLIY